MDEEQPTLKYVKSKFNPAKLYIAGIVVGAACAVYSNVDMFTRASSPQKKESSQILAKCDSLESVLTYKSNLRKKLIEIKNDEYPYPENGTNYTSNISFESLERGIHKLDSTIPAVNEKLVKVYTSPEYKAYISAISEDKSADAKDAILGLAGMLLVGGFILLLDKNYSKKKMN